MKQQCYIVILDCKYEVVGDAKVDRNIYFGGRSICVEKLVCILLSELQLCNAVPDYVCCCKKNDREERHHIDSFKSWSAWLRRLNCHTACASGHPKYVHERSLR